MFKTFDTDRPIIERKYNIPEEITAPHHTINRFAYHGYDYDPTSGLSDEAMNEGIAALAAELDIQNLPHPVYKAKLLAYVLDNTQIDTPAHDYFFGLRAWGRLISKYTVGRWEADNKQRHPNELERLRMEINTGTNYGALDYDHTVPNWDLLTEKGFPGVLAMVHESYENIKEKGELTDKKEALYRGMVITYEAIIRFLDRLAKRARTQTHAKAEKMAVCFENLRDGAPTDTYEALQLIYAYFMISESIDNYQVRSLGHGLDQTLYPYFVSDIESGRYTKEEIGELIAYFLMQWQAINNYWGQPVYLGGANPDGTTRVNELSYYILDIYDKLGLYNPKLQLKIYTSTPSDFKEKALEMVRHGTSSIVFLNGDMITKCLMARGATYEEAVDSVISGCYEYKTKGKGIGIGVSYYNMLKGISMVFDNGVDTPTGIEVGLKTGEISEFDTFDKFYKAYLEQTRFMLHSYLDAVDGLATDIADINPSLMFSATIDTCRETLTDALDSGTDNYITGCLTSGIGTAVDALMAVRELVYEKKVVTLEEMKAALDANWEGYEALRKKALSMDCKYGNGNIVADSYAAALLRFVYDSIADKKNCHGGKYVIDGHSARAFLIHGEKTKATPDGRRHGDETSKNFSPTPGADRKGITALIRSATHVDTSLCTEGYCLDAMLHPSAVQGEDGMIAMRSVLDTYMNKGGQSIQFNIFSAEMLRDAQAHPEKYKNLQVRVCGWNILWNDMAKVEQDAYILRAENIG